ncbi:MULTISPECIES: DUF1254 domain-containing protein [unclassified Caballeronia]|uniref:DUF1254 domain-containing protein n=1 Tax=unclassified Caballeronia TaxID=2646786 RepID=UPI0028611745|nr:MULTISPECIES: DUF1254 domain-containing protein [unclassified Caballeronia]MDR5814767.1 DUF1254 domain-containing protein [Caballeronia sp. LZ033]MDR5821248.1 DUF1254 domain-containing protein [Caballeronia sp. LZ043]
MNRALKKIAFATFATAATHIAVAQTGPAQPSQSAAATTPGPVPGYVMSEAYARSIARTLYVWAWPMTNVYNRLLAARQVKEPGLNEGIVPLGPPNQLSMLHDYMEPAERFVACPNQDVVYGSATLDLDASPVVVQVPNFGSRFWVFQVVDTRTDSFANLGKMYGTKPGFYLLVGPNWKGSVPKGISKVFRSPTSTGLVIPRVFMDDTQEDRQAIQQVINGIGVYPASEYTGKPKATDWSKLPTINQNAGSGEGEIRFVDPEKFWDELPLVLKAAPPMPGEASLYSQAKGLLMAAQQDPAIKAAIIDESKKAETEIISPLLNFNSFGKPLANHWNTISNGAAFGTDYFTRTAVARSNILVNKSNETKYFYLDNDAGGQRLNGSHAYTVTFAKGSTPPVKGFWSLTLYNAHHFFAPNDIKRYSVGTKNKDLKLNPDGTLTVYIQSTPPEGDKRANWLPSPANEDFSLYVRAYWPETATLDGTWNPPAVQPAQ